MSCAVQAPTFAHILLQGVSGDQHPSFSHGLPKEAQHTFVQELGFGAMFYAFRCKLSTVGDVYVVRVGP